MALLGIRTDDGTRTYSLDQCLAGELDPNDFPEQSKAQEEAAKKETDTETPPAYKPNTMVKPSETQVEVPKTQVESTAIPATQ